MPTLHAACVRCIHCLCRIGSSILQGAHSVTLLRQIAIADMLVVNVFHESVELCACLCLHPANMCTVSRDARSCSCAVIAQTLAVHAFRCADAAKYALCKSARAMQPFSPLRCELTRLVRDGLSQRLKEVSLMRRHVPCRPASLHLVCGPFAVTLSCLWLGWQLWVTGWLAGLQRWLRRSQHR